MEVGFTPSQTIFVPSQMADSYKHQTEAANARQSSTRCLSHSELLAFLVVFWSISLLWWQGKSQDRPERSYSLLIFPTSSLWQCNSMRSYLQWTVQSLKSSLISSVVKDYSEVSLCHLPFWMLIISLHMPIRTLRLIQNASSLLSLWCQAVHLILNYGADGHANQSGKSWPAVDPPIQ